MYKTVVRKRKFLNGSDAIKIFLPLAIWLMSCWIAFLIFVKISPMAFPLFLLSFFSIIPVLCYCRKQIAIFNEHAFVNEEVVFHVTDGILYVGDTKLNVIKKQREIYVDNIAPAKPRLKYNGSSLTYTFIGTIQEPYVDDFIKFLEEQHVAIQIEAN